MQDDGRDEDRGENRKVYFKLLGNREWHEIPAGEKTTLHGKIEQILYDRPDRMATPATKLTDSQRRRIEILSDELAQPFDFRENGIRLACLFINAQVGGQTLRLPIIKSASRGSGSGSSVYVDTRARLFSAWHSSLGHGELTPGTYCDSFDGFHEADHQCFDKLSFLPSSGDDINPDSQENFAPAVKQIMDFCKAREERSSRSSGAQCANGVQQASQVYDFMSSLVSPDSMISSFEERALRIIERVQDDTLCKYGVNRSDKVETVFNQNIDRLLMHCKAQQIQNLSKIYDTVGTNYLQAPWRPADNFKDAFGCIQQLSDLMGRSCVDISKVNQPEV